MDHQSNISVLFTTDTDGASIVVVTNPKGESFKVLAEDWPSLSADFGDIWFVNANSNGRPYFRRHDPNAPLGKGGRPQITLQRAVMRAKRGQRVKFIDGDTSNCRRDNLEVQSKEDAARDIAAILNG